MSVVTSWPTSVRHWSPTARSERLTKRSRRRWPSPAPSGPSACCPWRSAWPTWSTPPATSCRRSGPRPWSERATLVVPRRAATYRACSSGRRPVLRRSQRRRRRRVRRVRRDADELGATWAHEFGQRIVTVARWWAGRLPEAAAEAEATLALTASLALGHDDDVPLGVLALVAVHGDDLAAAQAHLDRAATSGHQYARPSGQHLLLADAMRARRCGDATRARGDRSPHPAARSAGAGLDVRARHGRPVRPAGRWTRAIWSPALSTRPTRSRRSSTLAAHEAGGLHLHAVLDGDVDGLVAAAKALRPVPRLMAQAIAMDDAGSALLAAGRVADGGRYLSEAAELYGSVGASATSNADWPSSAPPVKPPPAPLDATGGRRQSLPRSAVAGRVACRPARGRRPHQPPDRREALPVALHGQHPPEARLRQAPRSSRVKLAPVWPWARR